MLKKRIIFCLLYQDGYFVQSRNFITNKIGDTNWIIENYNFSNISNFIDELIIIDISKEKKISTFLKNVEQITKKSFIPLTIGGGINSIKKAGILLETMCDKVLINTGLFETPKLINQVAKKYGNQSIVAALDYRYENNKRIFYKQDGNVRIIKSFKETLNYIQKLPVGEIILNSIDRDGTGQGLDENLVNQLKI